MGTVKTPVRVFNGLLGLDLTSDDINRDPEACIAFKNLERLYNNSLRGREGFKLFAQPLYILGHHKYVYTDDNNQQQEELICAGVLNPDRPAATPGTLGNELYGPYDWYGTLFRLKEGTFTIQYTGSNAWDVEITFDTSTTSLHLKLYDNGSEVLDEDLGKGTEDTPVTLKDIADAINAVTNFSCSCPKTAVLNGSQTSSPYTVDSGHTLSLGDWVFIKNAYTTYDDFTECIGTTTTTVSIQGKSDPSLADNEVIGHGLYPASILSLQAQQGLSGAGSIDISYFYWDPIPSGSFMIKDTPGVASYPGSMFPLKDAVAKGYQYGANFSAQNQCQPSFVDQYNCCYFSSEYASEVPLRKVVGEIDNNSFEEVEFYGGLWKYDGKDVYLSGPINIYRDGVAVTTTFPAASLTGSSGLADGDYKYQFSILKKDYRGNEVESFLEFIRDATVSGGPKTVRFQVDLYDANNKYTIPYRQFDIRSIQANGLVSSANVTFTVDAGHLLRTGDTVFFVDNSGVFQERKIVSWTATTIVLDTAATIPDNGVITNACIRAWRTVASGSEFFLAAQYPIVLSTGYVTNVDDSTADADLGININAVKENSTQYNFPAMKAIESHQGLIVGAGGRLGSQVAWEDSLYIESLDYARNVKTITSGKQSGISTLKSDTSSSLYALQENDAHEVYGSFGNSEAESSRVLENTYGSSGVHTTVQIKKTLFNICKLGLSFYPIGSEDVIADTSILKVFRNLDNIGVPGIDTTRAYLFWDSKKNWIHVVLPFEAYVDDSGVSGQDFYVPLTTSRHFVIQLSENNKQSTLVSEFTYADGLDVLPLAGAVSYADKFIFSSRQYDTNLQTLKSFTFVRLDTLLKADEKDLFSDNGAAYEWDMIPQWDDGDSPEYNKAWHEFELYQLQPDDFVATFSITFKSFRDWVLLSTKKDTDRTLTFTSSADLSSKIQFDPGYKAKRRAIELSGTVNKNPPIFSGYSYTVDERVYEKDKFGR